jgi:hypothetical protein
MNDPGPAAVEAAPPPAADNPPSDSRSHLVTDPKVGEVWHVVEGGVHWAGLIPKGPLPEVHVPPDVGTLIRRSLSDGESYGVLQRLEDAPQLVDAVLADGSGGESRHVARAILDAATNLLQRTGTLLGRWTRNTVLWVGHRAQPLLAAAPGGRPLMTSRAELAELVLYVLGYPATDDGFHACYDAQPELAGLLFGAIRPDTLDLDQRDAILWVAAVQRALGSGIAPTPFKRVTQAQRSQPRRDPWCSALAIDADSPAPGLMSDTRWRAVAAFGAAALMLALAAAMFR